MLETAAAQLGVLNEKVVYVGAATLPLWVTDPGATVLRPTADVDVVVEVVSLVEYSRFEQRLRDAGFRDDGEILGRFHAEDTGLQLDAIPADASILGFDNRWQRASLPAAVTRTLPSGVGIRVLPPANLLATKLEAFANRGKRDYLGGHDFEDIVAFVDGRAELVGEVRAAASELRSYIAERFSGFLEDARAVEAIPAHLEFGRGGTQRAERVVVPRFEALATSSGPNGVAA